MIVLDASAAVDWLLDTFAGEKVEQRISADMGAIHAPHLLDLEVAQVLRSYVRLGIVSESRGDAALYDLTHARIRRYSHSALLPRIWQLRHNLTAYDAAYIALAELLDVPVLTRDQKMASAPGHHARVEVI
ncbi:MAG: type II toxin-antitoxin system VapC family toxin [Acidobacteria bacterium]|nr:type II toxin-antitoxin system VapC family toxin [Acidobacteriota bacterium]MBV9145926.1 type II toxin-antitoxin system VapC family toxin [Acidobacteriota bacterium]MBV9438183.1 type II toxin-antitoxin system VapC family toxin [Acidobacteriota bacterium]